MSMVASVLDAAIEYAGYGWRVVPLHGITGEGNCTCGGRCDEMSGGPGSRGKHPRLKEWQKKATDDEALLEDYFGKWPLSNIGVRLGEESGIVDIECDTEEAEKRLLVLFDGDLPVTPCFSSSRGKHRLFRWREDLPGGATVPFDGIDLKFGNKQLGSQSVFPPSTHRTGAQYQWLTHPEEANVADIPDSVVAKLWNFDPTTVGEGSGKVKRDKEHWEKVLAGSSEGSRRNNMASYIGKLLSMSMKLEETDTVQVLYEGVASVNANNQPPLDESELKPLFLDLLKKEQNQRTERESQEILRPTPEQQAEKPKDTGSMELVIVKSDPQTYELYAPQFEKAEDGCLYLTSRQLLNPAEIRREALEQAEYPLPLAFAKAWNKKDGIYERLVFNATRKESPPEEHRRAVIAGRLMEELTKRVKTLEGDALPPTTGKPAKLPDGSVVFLFTPIWENLRYSADEVKRKELSKLLQIIGITTQDFGTSRYKKLTKDGLGELRRISRHSKG